MKVGSRLSAVVLAALLLLSSCRTAGPQTAAIFAMDTVMDFTVYGGAQTLADAEARVRELETLFSVTSEESELSALNRSGGGTVSAETAALIPAALALCERTGGALDITVYPVVRAWGFTAGDRRVPSGEELAALSAAVDYRGVSVKGNAVTLAQGAEIDLGSVAKGYTADRLTEQLRAAGVESALLNLGGNVQAIGKKPNGHDWRVAIRDPQSKKNIAVLAVSNRAVVTSGGYERFFERDGVTYHHIIDPATGCPAKSGLLSVTVVAESGLLADALSTALYVMGLDRAAEHWRAYRDFEAVFVDENGTIFLTEGLQSCFSPISRDAAVEVIRL